MLIDPVDSRIEKYLIDLARVQDDPILLEMELLARKKDFPIVGRLLGLFLEVLAKSVGAKTIFEFGSGYGYSAYWFARAVGPEGKVICTDGKKDNRDQAEKFLGRAGVWNQIDFNVGMAQDVFRTFGGSYDICYNDVDKGEYPEVWKMAKERIRPGG